MFDVIQYGLSNVCDNEESTIAEEDIDTILAKSEVKRKEPVVKEMERDDMEDEEPEDRMDVDKKEEEEEEEEEKASSSSSSSSSLPQSVKR